MIRPAGFRVLVDPLPLEEKIGSILIAHDPKQREAQQRSRVVAIGPIAWKDHHGGEPWAKVGDVVIHDRYAGVVIRDRKTQKEYRALNDEDVVAIEDGE